MAKRKSEESQQQQADKPLRRSSRRRDFISTYVDGAAAAAAPAEQNVREAMEPSAKLKSSAAAKKKKASASVKPAEVDKAEKAVEKEKAPKKTMVSQRAKQNITENEQDGAFVAAAANPKTKSKEIGPTLITPTIPLSQLKSSQGPNRQYWIMKAEPESRFENGVDVKFSIDDLAAKTEPEPWDGIRNAVARNNLRSMKVHDLAFFYHSNCKDPGIVGVMEIIGEHQPDLSAHDNKTAYYDPTSYPSKPKWSLVHVEFRTKLPVTISLREIKGAGGALENMQMIRQNRLSVSKVAKEEWDFLLGMAEEKAKSIAAEAAAL